jgi:hypothetical protein
MAGRNKRALALRNATDPKSWFDRVDLYGHQRPLQTSTDPGHSELWNASPFAPASQAQIDDIV